MKFSVVVSIFLYYAILVSAKLESSDGKDPVKSSQNTQKDSHVSPKALGIFRNVDDIDLVPLTPQVLVKGSEFWFGTQMYASDGRLAPVVPPDGARLRMHVPKMQDFWIDEHSVTNAQFKSFVDATGYKTEAERFRWSFVLDYEANDKTRQEVDSKQGYGRVKEAKHWMAVKGASWRRPFGSADKSVQKLDRMDHPAVHLSFQDAEEYCHWASGTDDEAESNFDNDMEGVETVETGAVGESDDAAKGGKKSSPVRSKNSGVAGATATATAARRILRLPTEFEYEFAARGGLHNQTYPWGDEAPALGTTGPYANNINIWHETDPKKRFPTECDESQDGYVGTAPAKYYAPNGYGLYNMVGNVWEWVLGGTPDKRTLRGGSYVDSLQGVYNHAANVATKQTNSGDSAASNVGFRCVSGGRLNIIREEYFKKDLAKRDAEQDVRSAKRNAEFTAKREQALKRKKETEAAEAAAKAQSGKQKKQPAKSKPPPGYEEGDQDFDEEGKLQRKGSARRSAATEKSQKKEEKPPVKTVPLYEDIYEKHKREAAAAAKGGNEADETDESTSSWLEL